MRFYCCDFDSLFRIWFASDARECDRFGATKDCQLEVPDRTQLDQNVLSFIESKTDLVHPKEKIASQWQSSPTDVRGPSLLDSLLSVLALSDSRLDRLVSQLEQPSINNPSAAAADLSWMDSSLPPWIQANIRLAVARALANQHLYDESLSLLESLDSSLVVDPSTWMFYQAVCYHHLLKKEDCITALDRLMERESELSRDMRSRQD